MFRIECFVTDKHLPDVLRALGQRVMNLSVLPVVDAAVERKGKQPKVKGTNGGGLEAFLAELRKAPAINKGSAELAAQASGYAPSSANHLIGRARKLGLIKSKGHGPGTTYSWSPAKPKGE